MPLLLPIIERDDACPVPWAPTADEIAPLAPAYTRGGYDDDRPSAGSERMTFGAETRPTLDDVNGLIVGACAEVAGRVGTTIPERHYGLARSAAKWRVVQTINGGKVGSDDAATDARSAAASYLTDVEELVRLCRMGPTRLA